MGHRTKSAAITAFTVVALLTFAGCSSGDGESESGGTTADEGLAQAAPEGAQAADSSGKSANAKLVDQSIQAAANRDIIYTVDLSLAVADVPAAAGEATSLAISSGGFVAKEATDGDDRSSITIKVPAAQHEGIVDSLADLGKVTSRNRSTEDVTQQVVDTESRIASQRASIDRIRKLLSEATKIGDVISIESELASREADLDALLQQQEELSSLASLATINLTLHHPADAPESDDPNTGFLAGLSGGWDAFVSAGTVALTVLGAVIPFAAVGAVVGVPAWYVWRQRRRPVVSPPAPEPERS